MLGFIITAVLLVWAAVYDYKHKNTRDFSRLPERNYSLIYNLNL